MATTDMRQVGSTGMSGRRSLRELRHVLQDGTPRRHAGLVREHAAGASPDLKVVKDARGTTVNGAILPRCLDLGLPVVDGRFVHPELGKVRSKHLNNLGAGTTEARGPCDSDPTTPAYSDDDDVDASERARSMVVSLQPNVQVSEALPDRDL